MIMEKLNRSVSGPWYLLRGIRFQLFVCMTANFLYLIAQSLGGTIPERVVLAALLVEGFHVIHAEFSYMSVEIGH